MGVVVAAKHFAGTYRPCSPTVVSDVTTSGVPVKRRLFIEPSIVKEVAMTSSEPTVEVQLLAATDSAPSVVRATQPVTHVEAVPGAVKTVLKTADDEWREDIWRSYGSREASLPSPIGCSRSPSVLFSAVSVGPATPLKQWSPSSDDFPWGPDSPVESLRFDSQVDIPNWPLFVDNKDGQELDRSGCVFQRRLAEWKTERTVTWARNKPKRRHHLRSRRDCRQHYESSKPSTVMDWSSGALLQRPANRCEVQLPSPPESQASLAKLRRQLLTAKLPQGCRVVPCRDVPRRVVPSRVVPRRVVPRRNVPCRDVPRRTGKRLLGQKESLESPSVEPFPEVAAAHRSPPLKKPGRLGYRLPSPDIICVVTDDEF